MPDYYLQKQLDILKQAVNVIKLGSLEQGVGILTNFIELFDQFEIHEDCADCDSCTMCEDCDERREYQVVIMKGYCPVCRETIDEVEFCQSGMHEDCLVAILDDDNEED